MCACAVASLCALTVVRSCDSQPEAFVEAGESRLSRDGNIPCMASELNHRGLAFHRTASVTFLLSQCSQNQNLVISKRGQ